MVPETVRYSTPPCVVYNYPVTGRGSWRANGRRISVTRVVIYYDIHGSLP